jgi:hypothetical protein
MVGGNRELAGGGVDCLVQHDQVLDAGEAS